MACFAVTPTGLVMGECEDEERILTMKELISRGRHVNRPASGRRNLSCRAEEQAVGAGRMLVRPTACVPEQKGPGSEPWLWASGESFLLSGLSFLTFIIGTCLLQRVALRNEIMHLLQRLAHSKPQEVQLKKKSKGLVCK